MYWGNEEIGQIKQQFYSQNFSVHNPSILSCKFSSYTKGKILQGQRTLFLFYKKDCEIVYLYYRVAIVEWSNIGYVAPTGLSC
ncbi:hypothetical protein AM1BK_23670 [Neobacillus kokaensis]|uniref:Uncharacterized protein n=1 Tax=Neobacillus kokaensis TaxID=2759023 RepID=A0ABQ3N3V3_9BACI|nr:hypothetical protein AM1BK_23670 [Neobacillus kokaensis]